MDTGSADLGFADFGHPREDYTTARAAAVTFELAGWTQVEIGGDDRAKFLHNFCTNDVRSLTPGTNAQNPRGKNNLSQRRVPQLITG